MKRPPSQQRKAVAQHVLRMFKGEPEVHTYYDEAKARSVSIITTLDTIEDGIKSVGTIGLSEAPLLSQNGNEFVTRVELCSAVPKSFELWESVVASTAFFIEQRRSPILPGAVLENVVRDFYPEIDMPHLYFSVPFLWNDGHFEELMFGSIRINWLQCFSIHEAEKDFIASRGFNSFEDILAQQEVDIFDMWRPPVDFNNRQSC
jgi:hypothetical protein